MQGIACFSPSAAASRIESSKAWSKDFMQRHRIPTAEYHCFRDYLQAKKYIESVGYRVVVKVLCIEYKIQLMQNAYKPHFMYKLLQQASGLAEGKGVLLPTTTAEAVQAGEM